MRNGSTVEILYAFKVIAELLCLRGEVQTGYHVRPHPIPNLPFYPDQIRRPLCQRRVLSGWS